MADATPMLQQYRQLKKRFPDAILLFRLGDFYEMFDEDARLISKQLGLVLTGRRFSKSVKMAMCGVPYRQLSVYVSKLLEKGHKVAVADQMEAPGKSRGLIAREIVRVITPGTVVEEALLAEKSQNFLAALAPSENVWGLAAVDLSTGEFVTAQFSGAAGWSQLLEEMNVLRPTELLLPTPFVSDEGWLAGLDDVRPARLSPLDPARFDPADASQRLLTHFAAASLDAYGCAGLPQATAAAGAILAYLQENQLSDLAHLTGLTTYRAEACVGLDPVTRRNLELTATLRDGRVQGSLLAVLDRTVTAMGARLLRRWIQQPLLELAPIVERLDAVQELAGQRTVNSEQSAVTSEQLSVTGRLSPVANPQSPIPVFLRSDLRKLLDGVHDMERSVGRVGFGTANARDLAGLRRTLSRIPRIKGLLKDAQSPRLAALNAELDPLQDVAGLISSALVDDPPILLKEGGLIRPGYHSELGNLRGAAADGRDWLTAYETEERERTGIASLRVRYNQIFGFFVEVPRSKSGLVPAEYERRATITHAERFVTPALRSRESQILAAEDRANELEYELFVELRQQVAAHSQRLLAAARLLAELDVLAALAESALQQNYCRPIVDESNTIRIEEGRHPVVEQLLTEGKRYVPNDIALDGAGRRMLILTGPNMSGKSVLTRQVVLTVLMAQMGSFVSARSAHIGLVDRIFVRAGASDDITQGRSTFLVEMDETAYILRHATARSLVVLDEVGRGTSTYDGMALAWAVGDELHDGIGCRSLFATHFHELTALADQLPGASNASLAVREQGQEVVFLHRLVEGGADRSYGVQVARLAGLPEQVIERARAVMSRLEGERKRHSAPQAAPTQAAPTQAAPTQAAPTQTEPPLALAEVRPLYRTGGEMLAGADDELAWAVLRELFRLDVANLTPMRALLLVNEWQQRLRQDE